MQIVCIFLLPTHIQFHPKPHANVSVALRQHTTVWPKNALLWSKKIEFVASLYSIVGNAVIKVVKQQKSNFFWVDSGSYWPSCTFIIIPLVIINHYTDGQLIWVICSESRIRGNSHMCVRVWLPHAFHSGVTVITYTLKISLFNRVKWKGEKNLKSYTSLKNRCLCWGLSDISKSLFKTCTQGNGLQIIVLVQCWCLRLVVERVQRSRDEETASRADGLERWPRLKRGHKQLEF